ncbi:MAG: hypothetical protein WC205_00730 [Opitutaceae bacterium]
MSSSVSPRSLSLVPFLAADAVLLLTALLIAWLTPDALTGGALFGVVFCVGLGAVLAVFPFIVNDIREREAALAVRQRELTELVNTTMDTASRWGTQWAAAATGLADAASLASRSIASAEQLPAVFQEKADGLTTRLADVEREAQARSEAALKQETALAARSEQIDATVSGLQLTLAEFGRVEAGLREQRTAIAAALAEFPVVAEAARTTAAEASVSAAYAKAAQTELGERIAAAPAQVEAQVARFVSGAETRLGVTTEALTVRLAELETTIVSISEQLQRAAVVPEPPPAPEPVPVPAPEPVVVSVMTDEVVARLAGLESALNALTEQWKEFAATPVVAPVSAPVAVSEAVPEVAPVEVPVEAREAAAVVEVAPVVAVSQTTLGVEVTQTAPVVEKPVVRSETIMDPFLIPNDGYAALADAMDLDIG